MQKFVESLGFISGGGSCGRVVWRSQIYVGNIVEKGTDWVVAKDGREITVRDEAQLVHALTTVAYDEGMARGKVKTQEMLRAALGIH